MHTDTDETLAPARRSPRSVVAFAVLLLATLGVLVPAAAHAEPIALEQTFIAKINELRASQGLSTLRPHEGLTGVGRAWSAKMRDAGEISHNPNLANQVTANWRRLGENVGVGPDVDALHDAFVRSPAHLRNLLDPEFQFVGIGVVEQDGIIWVTEQFMTERSAPVTTTPPTTRVPSVLALAAPAPRTPAVASKSTKSKSTRSKRPTTARRV